MPSYGPEVLGPPPRDPEQKYWDPEVQTMDPEKMRALQNERLAVLLRKVFDNPVPLFKDKLAAAGIGGARGREDRRRPAPRAAHGEAGPARLRGRGPALRPVPVHRPPRRGARGDVDGDDGHAHHLAVDAARHLDRVRVLGPHVVALRVPARDDRHPRPPRLPLRRRAHAVGLLRVLRDAQHLGAAARHRRGRRAGPALLDPGEARHPLHGLLDGPVLRGGRQARHRPQRRRARVQGHARVRHGQGHAAHDGGGRVLRVRGRGLRPAPRRAHQRGLGRGPGRRPRHRGGGRRRGVGRPRRHHARPRQRPAALRPRGGVRHPARAVPVRRDEHPGAVGRPLQGPHRRAGQALPGQRGGVRPAGRARRDRAHPRVADGAARRREPRRRRCGWSAGRVRRATTPRWRASARRRCSERLGIDTVIEVLDRETIPRSGYKAARVVDE